MNLKFTNIDTQVTGKFVIKEKGSDKLIEYRTTSESGPVVVFDTEDDAKHFIANMIGDMNDILEVVSTHTSVFEHGAILMQVIREEGDKEYEC